MSPHDFYTRWASRLHEAHREQFLLELATLITLEQARERRRVCTDDRHYRDACDETAAEISVVSAEPAHSLTA
jgi:hypothetical protein